MPAARQNNGRLPRSGTSAVSARRFLVNLKELKEILQLLDEKEIAEFELEEEA